MFCIIGIPILQRIIILLFLFIRHFVELLVPGICYLFLHTLCSVNKLAAIYWQCVLRIGKYIISSNLVSKTVFHPTDDEVIFNNFEDAP
jgi:hypothetical protein